MPRWERLLVSIVGALWMLGCGSDEPPPALTPAPTELPAPEVPTPVAPPEPETTESPETPAPETPETPETPEIVAAELPVVPVIAGEASIAPPMPELEELDHESATFEMSRGTTSYDEVAYPPAVQGALLRQLRATMRDLLDGFVPEPETDESMGSYYDASCRVNLALPDTVAYTCTRTITEGRGEMETVSTTKLFAITGENVRALESDNLLIAGANLRALAERYEADTNGPMTLTYRGVGFVDQDGEVTDIPYEDLGALLDPTSAAGRVPGVTAIAAVTTALALEAGPPATISVLAPARPLPSAAMFAVENHANWIFSERAGAISATTSMVVADMGALPAGTTSVTRPWSTPLRVHRAHLHRASPLRPGPRGAGEGAALPAGTLLYAVLGDTGAGPSRTGGGQWTFVAVSETRMGWLPSALVRESDDVPITPSLEAFVSSFPEAERAAVRGSTYAIGAARGFLFVSERSGNTTVGVVPSPSYGVAPGLRIRVTRPGSLIDAQVAGAQSTYDVNPLLVLTWAVASDPAHVLVEVFAAPATGVDSTPAFTATLASASAPARERQRVAVNLTRRGRYAPVVVRGPGRAEVLYTWNGTTLVAAE